MSQTVTSTSCNEFVSQLPRNFLFAKNTKNYREYTTVYLNEAPTGHFIASGTGEKGALTSSWLGAHRPIEQQQPGRRQCVKVCTYACERDVFAISDNII